MNRFGEMIEGFYQAMLLLCDEHISTLEELRDVAAANDEEHALAAVSAAIDAARETRSGIVEKRAADERQHGN